MVDSKLAIQENMTQIQTNKHEWNCQSVLTPIRSGGFLDIVGGYSFADMEASDSIFMLKPLLLKQVIFTA